MSKADEPAFPIKGAAVEYQCLGLTKREYFAVTILAGMHASTPGSVHESCVGFAVKEANALLAELDKADAPYT